MARKHDNNPKRTSNPQGKTGKGRRGQSRSAASKNSRKSSVGEGLCPSRSARKTPSARPAERHAGCALCPVFGRCGGCSQLDVPYEAQLAAKQQAVADLFTGLAPEGVLLPILGMDDPFHYRNKVVSPYAPTKGRAGKSRKSAPKGGRGAAAAKLTRADILTGMYAPGTHRLIPTDACAIENETAKRVTLAVRDIMARWNMPPYDEDTGEGFIRHVVVRVGHQSGEVLVTVVTNGEEFPSSKAFCRELKRRVPEITTIVQNVNTRATNVILGEKERTLFGPGFILDTLCGLSFRISSQSFYQVNATQTEVLYDEAIRLANLTGNETVIDAYCGTGTIGLVAAKRGAAQVIGVDAVASSIRDAAANARHNGVENAQFVAEDATKFMRELAEEVRQCPGGVSHLPGDALREAPHDASKHETPLRGTVSPEAAPLVLLMDPPRAGSTPEFLEAACSVAPDRIVYISCNPETQARDVRQLVEGGYTVKALRPVDMFPHTHHVESIVLLEKGHGRGHEETVE